MSIYLCVLLCTIALSIYAFYSVLYLYLFMRSTLYYISIYLCVLLYVYLFMRSTICLSIYAFYSVLYLYLFMRSTLYISQYVSRFDVYLTSLSLLLTIQALACTEVLSICLHIHITLSTKFVQARVCVCTIKISFIDSTSPLVQDEEQELAPAYVLCLCVCVYGMLPLGLFLKN